MMTATATIKQRNDDDRLKEIFKKVRRIEITTKKVVNEVMAGEYHSVFKGRGMEFTEVREYYPGDDVRTIDWNVTARTGRPHVKVFSEERELTVILMVDASSSLAFGTRDKTKGELAAELSALIAFSAIENHDRVGLIIFTDRIERSLPPKKGRRHVLRVIREVLSFRPATNRTDLAMALEYLSRIQRRRAVVFLISDFISPDYSRALRIANRRHDLVAMTLSDPREREIPPLGLVELEDAETGESRLIDTYDDATRDRFAELAGIRTAERARHFRSMDLDSLELGTAEPYEQPLLRFFRERARKFR